MVDASGGIVISNAAYRRIFQNDEDENPLVDEKDNPIPADELPVAQVARGAAFTLQFGMMLDGHRHWFEARGGPLTEPLQDAVGVVVIRDITDRSLRLLQEQFMAIASHELRTPLTALHGYLQIAQRRLHSGQDAVTSIDQYIERALRQSARLRELISELIDAHRAGTGRLLGEQAPVDLTEVVHAAVEVAQSMASGQQISVRLPAQATWVRGDTVRLEQVVLNLLTNAIRYAGEHAEIGVSLRRRDQLATLAVTDNGPGIPKEARAGLFRPLYDVVDPAARGASAAKAPRAGGGPGLGLGLYISSEIVKAHGGRITVRSRTGAGTTFRVELPLAD